MDFTKVVKQRRSIRKYKDKKIKINILKKIVSAGRFAPSARKVHPFKFIIINSKERLKGLADIIGENGKFIGNASACIIVVCKDTKYYLEDGCAATQNILLSAFNEGIGSCWIAGDKKDYAVDVLKFINAPSFYKLVSIISLGYPDEKPQVKKPSLKDVFIKDKF